MAPVTATAARRVAARVPGVARAYNGWHRRRDQRRAEAWATNKRTADERRLAELATGSELRLNVGSSDRALDGWVNLDIRLGEGSLYMDATRPWPFRDGSAAAVNSEHFIEHLTVDDVRDYLREAFRVLRPGGVIRTSTPDLEGLCRAFLERDPAVLETHRRHGYTAVSHGDMVNNYVYLWDHRHIWDFESLRRLLQETGFTQVERSSFGRSAHAPLANIDRHDPEELHGIVLWIDAVRP